MFKNKKVFSGFAPILILMIVAVIGVAGYFGRQLYKTYGSGLIKSQPLESSSVPISTQPTPIWKTYTDPQNRFEISYPNHADIKTDTDFLSVGFGDPTGEDAQNAFGFSVTLYKLELQDYLENHLCDGKERPGDLAKMLYESCINGFINNKTSFKLDNVTGIKSKLMRYEWEGDIYIFENSGYVYRLLYSAVYGNDISDQILSTFKFLDSGPTVSAPLEGSVVKSPLKVSGEVPAGWMFEGSFPIKLIDSNGKIIIQGIAKEVLPGSWQSGNAVKFEVSLTFPPDIQGEGYVLLENDNPSGDPINLKTYKIKVNFNCTPRPACLDSTPRCMIPETEDICPR